MKQYKYLIIGGGVAGTTAAGTIREKDPSGTIAIISDEPHYLYSRIMLSKPNFFLGEIPFNRIWLRDKNWYHKKDINFIGGKTATRLDHENKTIKLNDATKLKYNKLLLATGVCPRPLPVPGVEKEGIYYLRTLDQGKSIIDAVKDTKRTVTIGGGFISFEMANLLNLAGAKVTMIIREKRIWENILDETSSHIIEQAIANSGVKIIKQAEVKQINGNIHVTAVSLKNNTSVPCDTVVCGIGAICNIDWLKTSGVNTDRGVLANQRLRTNLPDVWAAGDAAQFDDPILEEEVQLGNWVNAQEQGRVAGLNMTGKDTPFTFVSFYTTHGFDISFSIIGNARPQKEFTTIARQGPTDNQRVQLLLVNDELVGAILINQTSVMQPITKIIESNIKLTDKKEQLADPNFDLSTILKK